MSILMDDWVSGNNINVIKYPVKSPDLNRIENVWGHRCSPGLRKRKAIYIVGTFLELKSAVSDAWDKIVIINILTISRLSSSEPLLYTLHKG